MKFVDIPILLLAHKRPHNTRQIEELIPASSRAYCFVDFAGEGSNLSRDVVDFVKSTFTNPQRSYKISDAPLGPGKAMIEAIDWVFDFEERVLILEDDVFLNEYAIDFVYQSSLAIKDSTTLITLRSPFQDQDYVGDIPSGYSKFCLTNGWILNREAWRQFQHHRTKSLFSELVTFVIRRPTSLRIEHFFFLSASALSRKELIRAWDTQFIFFTLLNNIQTLTPNRSCVEIRGVDSVASNTLPASSHFSDVFWPASKLPPSLIFSKSRSVSKVYNAEIRDSVYKIRPRHFFSPIKSLLQIIKHR
ncbi:hypothetical protein A1sIA79_00215 [Candidatus Planktophila versatilis]|uniref:Glycosyltransferase n=1 Tax=Candidatus Planktophila versatilis TaxID=1884905 RepID=A0ABN5BEJ7_9ACTN|nr:hypothetical protein A1sIA79_00215 [Candidatus Planktophila versatilis]